MLGKVGCATNPISAIAKYGSLIYGIKEVIGDDVNMNKIIGAGAVYAVASFLDYLGSRGPTDMQNRVTHEKIENLEKRLE